jgi:hypothetical protein
MMADIAVVGGKKREGNAIRNYPLEDQDMVGFTLELVLVRQNVTAKWCRNVPSDGFQ